VVICLKKQKQCLSQEREAGDCWIALSLADSSGLILAARVGKHTDELIEQLVTNTEGKTDCKQFNSDDWGGYERVLPPSHRQGQNPAIRAHKWHCSTANWTMASTAEQVRQTVGTDEGDNSFSGGLLQLDLAAFSMQNNRSTTSRTSNSCLDLARYCCLSHINVTHYRIGFAGERDLKNPATFPQAGLSSS
jgi:hypothetical protein